MERGKRWLVKRLIQVKGLDMSNVVHRRIYEQRVARCGSCPYRTKERYAKCGICRCYIDLKVETLVNRNREGEMEITHCPKGYWNDDLLYDYLKEQL